MISNDENVSEKSSLDPFIRSDCDCQS